MQIENYAYPVVVDALHTVFSPYGFVQKIAIFEKNQTWQVCSSLSTFRCMREKVRVLSHVLLLNGGGNGVQGSNPIQ